MKAIILISSIFYFIGLKIADKVNLVHVKKPVEKIITNTITTKNPGRNYIFGIETEKGNSADTLKENTVQKDHLEDFK